MPTKATRYALAIAALVAGASQASAQTAEVAPRDTPTRSLPVPDNVSPQMQRLIAAPLRQGWNTPPTTADGWKALAATGAAATAQSLPAMRERLRVRVEPAEMDGVKLFIVTPEDIPPENRNSLLVHVHSGCYVLTRLNCPVPMTKTSRACNTVERPDALRGRASCLWP